MNNNFVLSIFPFYDGVAHICECCNTEKKITHLVAFTHKTNPKKLQSYLRDYKACSLECANMLVIQNMEHL